MNNNYNPYHRKQEDIQRQLLNYLHVNGPVNVTKCCLYLAINHKQIKRALADLVIYGFIIKKEIHKMQIIGRTKGRKGYRRVDFMNNTPLNRLPPRAMSVLSITPLGVTYLEKMNRIARLLRWEI